MRVPLTRIAVVLATAAASVALSTAPASASHPCHVDEPCEGHWCPGLSLEPPFVLVRC